MLIIPEETREHHAAVRRWAEENGILAQFEAAMKQCDEYAGDRVEFKLYYDFAPHSFSFLIVGKDGKIWFNGGLIYQGPDVPADGSFPSLTVTLGNPTKVGWFMHT